jgi:hypothetical protein
MSAQATPVILCCAVLVVLAVLDLFAASEHRHPTGKQKHRIGTTLRHQF